MPQKILVVEDNPSAMRLVEFVLTREGYQVVTATNGLEGLRKATEEGPDLLILDVMLPGLDGFEVAHRLRANPKTAQIPILMHSAKTQESDIATGKKVGVDDYLTKPASPAVIVEKVAAVLARRRAKQEGGGQG